MSQSDETTHAVFAATSGAAAARVAAEGRERAVSVETDQPVFDVMRAMTLESLEHVELEPETLMMVRLAALVAVDAPPASYYGNLAVAEEVGLTVAQLQSVLIAVAPIVGTPHVMSAVTNIADGLGTYMKGDRDGK
jgi:4-carboxymuconolactone decarboxylase